MDENLSNLNASIVLEKIRIILVLCQNFNILKGIHEGYLGICKKKNQSRMINMFLITIQSISCQYIMMKHNNFFYNFWQIILQFWDSCNKNYVCACKIICLHLYFHFISICQITIYVWPLEEPTVISIKLIYYRFVAYLS